MQFKGICECGHSLTLNFISVGVSPSIFIFRLGEIRRALYGIPTGRCSVKIREGPTVIIGTDDTIFTICFRGRITFSDLNVPLD